MNMILKTLRTLLLTICVMGNALADLNTGLVAYYPFDGNAKDASGNGNHGTELGGVSYSAGKSGQAASFDGESISLNNLFASSSNFSVSAWFKVDLIDTHNYIVSKEASLILGMQSGSVVFRIYNSSSWVTLDSPLSDTGSYHHVTGTWDSNTGAMMLYVDGQLVDTGSQSSMAINENNQYTNNTYIGSYNPPNDSRSFNGQIDDVRIYNRALSPSEIQQLSQGSSTNSDPIAVPSAPTLNLLTNDLTVSLNWGAVNGAKGYKLYYAPYPYTGPDSIGFFDMGNTNKLSVDLWEGAAFYVAIKSYNSVGNSDYSNIRLACTLDDTKFVHGMEYDDDIYGIYTSPASNLNILESPNQWINDVIVAKNGCKMPLIYDEGVALLNTIVNQYSPSQALAGSYWDDNWGVWRNDCWKSKSIACGQATWGFDHDERKGVYKDLITQLITGYPNPADRKVATVTDEDGTIASVDAIPEKYKTSVEKLVGVSDASTDALGLVNSLIGLGKDGYATYLENHLDETEGITPKSIKVFKNAVNVIQGGLILTNGVISYNKRLIIHEYLASYLQTFEILDELKNAHQYVTTYQNPKVDAAFLDALNEIEDEVAESADSMSNGYLSAVLGALDDNLESVINYGTSIAINENTKAGKYFITKLKGTLKSTQATNQATAALGSLVSLGVNSVFLLRDTEREWENIFLSAHIQHLLSVYWDNTNSSLVSISYDNEGDSYYNLDEQKTDQRERVVNLLDASTILYYDTTISLVDTDWMNVMIDVAGSALSGVSTGTALTPLPYFGSAVSVGSALGKTASCESVIIPDFIEDLVLTDPEACKIAKVETDEHRKRISDYYNAMDTWRSLIGDLVE